MKCLALLLVLSAQISGPAQAVSAVPQDAPVATQSERANPKSGWTVIDSFPHIELVAEGTGQPNLTLTQLIADPGLRSLVESGAFSSLQVRNPAIRAGEAQVDGTSIHVPYAASVKQSLGAQTWTNGDQGTINVQGELTIEFDGKNLRVTVTRFSNSTIWENAGQWLGYNQHVNLEFAREIAPPQIEHWFNEDPARAQYLLSLIQASRTPKP